MTKNEYKIQVSKKYPNGIIWLVRGDDLDELMKGLSFVQTFIAEEGLLKEGVTPRVKQRQDAEYSQDPADKRCPVHINVKSEEITEEMGNWGKPYYWHFTTDEQYFTERFPEPPWRCFCKAPKG